MGCDIHAYLERKLAGEWHMITPINGYDGGRGGDRDYDFFSNLCGVRRGYDNDAGTYPEPKGLPEDTSTVVQWHSDGWDCDGHSHSWETAVEFVEKKLALDRIRDSKNELSSQEWESYKILGYSIEDDGGEEVDNTNLYRVVFWFDN
jgi:hypothetical protein